MLNTSKNAPFFLPAILTQLLSTCLRLPQQRSPSVTYAHRSSHSRVSRLCVASTASPARHRHRRESRRAHLPISNPGHQKPKGLRQIGRRWACPSDGPWVYMRPRYPGLYSIAVAAGRTVLGPSAVETPCARSGGALREPVTRCVVVLHCAAVRA